MLFFPNYAPFLRLRSLKGLQIVQKIHFLIDQFRYIKIQLKTIDLSTRLWGINTEFVGFIPQSLLG